MKQLLLCDRKGCANVATHQAEVVMYAPTGDVPAVGVMGICVCSEHATDENARALLSEAGKRKLEEGFDAIGRMRPDWGRSFVRWTLR